MITITLYQFNKKVNSTAQPGAGVSSVDLSCLVKSPSSVMSPTIELQTNPLAYNYAYIAAFNRYYFIDDIVFNSGLWICRLSCDVLASFKDEIRTQSMYVLRSASNYDGTLLDTLYPSSTDVVKVQTSPDQIGYTIADTFANGAYIIGVQGIGMATDAGVIYYYVTPAEFTLLLHAFYNNSGDGSFWGNLQKGVIDSIYNITDYITSCRWYPVKPDITGLTAETIYLGSFNTQRTGYRMRSSGYGVITRTYILPAHPQASTRGEFLNASQYTRRVLVDPLIGTYTVNNADFSDLDTEPSLACEIRIDFMSGQALYGIWANEVSVNSKPVYYTYINFGIDINLGESIVNVGGAIANVAESIGNAITGNWLGAAANIGTMAAHIVPANRASGSAGGYAQFCAAPVMISYFQNLADEDLANRGRPLCQLTLLNTLSGFLMVDRPHAMISGTEQEASAINSYLAAGAYYE